MVLQSPLTKVHGVGPTLAIKYAQIGIKTVEDLIYYYPKRYEDYSRVMKTSQLRPGIVTIEAEIKEVKGRYARRGLHITEAVASDMYGSVRLVWFNQPYRAAAIQPHRRYYISGNYELARQRFAILNPSAELVSDFPLNTARILAVYRETKGLTSRQIRASLKQLLSEIDQLPETLPAWLVSDNRLLSHKEAVRAIHFRKHQKS